VIYKAHDTQYNFERDAKKLVVFALKGRFHELLPTVLRFRTDLQGRDTRYTFERHDKKTCHFCILGTFSDLLPIVLGFHGDLQGI
jgi:hypothetical protein